MIKNGINFGNKIEIMRIKINSIRADLLDASTMNENEFLIDHWDIDYEIDNIDTIGKHSVRGTLKWTAVPIPYKIIKFITWFYGKKIKINIEENDGKNKTI